MTTQTNKYPMTKHLVRVTWNQVSDTEWHAGGIASGYIIRQTRDVPKNTFHGAHYTLFRREGDGPEAYMTSSGSLDFAKEAAQTHCDGQVK